MDLAQTLKDFRQANGLEQGDLAQLLDTTQQTISNWESGTMPRSGALNRINHLLKTYKAGEKPSPWVAPTYDPAITEIHEIPVDKEKQRQRLDEMREARFKSEPGTRIHVAQSLDRIIERPMADTAFMPRFKEALFASLSQDIEYEREAVVKLQGVQARADYISRKVCAVIKGAAYPGGSALLDIGILQLLTLREIHRRQNEPRNVYMLVVATPDIARIHHSMNRLLNLAALHDIQVFIATTPEECAALLAAMELGSSAGDDFLDY